MEIGSSSMEPSEHEEHANASSVLLLTSSSSSLATKSDEVPYPLLMQPLKPLPTHVQLPTSVKYCRLLRGRSLPPHPRACDPPPPPLEYFVHDECRKFLMRGICKKYKHCNLIHPYSEEEFDPYPVRDAENCKFFMTYRFCLMGCECPYNHPKEVGRLCLDGVDFDNNGHPLHPGRPACSRGNNCRYGAFCWKHHPH